MYIYNFHSEPSLCQSLFSIAHAATPPSQPRVFPNTIELEALYKTGVLKVECAALQLVGFDESIYRAVKRVQMAKVPPKPAKYL
ncbi:uncharacterized protein C8R40DRAFT_1092664 [Lentinula edodes]|uniref:uncharacterized protein n=1 Tax=Lentinula edodes TaxID=5353 RepID=UPI001E8E11BD|nr:uncharacterized protein C8R40DRAFT_1092664 [Lentinula edodes]KAH7877842.1 hypothetical protein C8R40DRAFT_1092664 [Lentinula edodes]